MELIDREDICDVSICEGISCSKCSFLNKEDNVCLLRKRVFELKAVDAIPVVHGHWDEIYNYTMSSIPKYECSICGRIVEAYGCPEEIYPYCHCGAKMDE